MSYAIFVKNHIHETIIDNTIDKCIFETNEQYKCQLCDDKSYANSISLKAHIRIIHNRKYFYKCDECEKTTKTAKELFDHISYRHRQSSIRLFDCEKCGKSFKSMSNMKHHIDSFHSNDPHKCQCNRCGKYFKSIELMRHHQRKTHSIRTISMRSMRANYQISMGLRSTYSKMRQQRIEHEHQWLLHSLTKLSSYNFRILWPIIHSNSTVKLKFDA